MVLHLLKSLGSRMRGQSHEENVNSSSGTHRSKAVSLDRKPKRSQLKLTERVLTVRRTNVTEHLQSPNNNKKSSKITDAKLNGSASTQNVKCYNSPPTGKMTTNMTSYSGDQSTASQASTFLPDPVYKPLESVTDSVPTDSTTLSSHRANSTLQFLSQMCPICKRVYGSASLGIHIRSCQAAHEVHCQQLAAKLAWENKLMRRPTHPPGTICFICGRRYTHASWRIHVPRCREQWRLWNSLLPKGKRRRMLPKTPEPSEEDLKCRVDRARKRGLLYFRRDDALDEVMLEASEINRLPLEMLWLR